MICSEIPMIILMTWHIHHMWLWILCQRNDRRVPCHFYFPNCEPQVIQLKQTKCTFFFWSINSQKLTIGSSAIDTNLLGGVIDSFLELRRAMASPSKRKCAIHIYIKHYMYHFRELTAQLKLMSKPSIKNSCSRTKDICSLSLRMN